MEPIVHYIVRSVSSEPVVLNDYGVTLNQAEEYNLNDNYLGDDSAAWRACYEIPSASVYQELHADPPTVMIRTEVHERVSP